MAITDGRYKSRACGQVVLGKSAKKGTPFIEFYFKLIGGENNGGEVKWTGYFPPDNPKVCVRTLESLQFCGWEGDDISEFADGELHGLDANEVETVVELEDYENDEGETRTVPRVQWVNKLGGHLQVQNAMSKEEAGSFGEQMKGLVLKLKSKKSPPPSEAAEFPFGANAKDAPKSEQKKTGTGGRKF